MNYLAKLQKDKRVHSVHTDSDGYWIHLHKGFADLNFDPLQPAHTIHEDKLSDVRWRMIDVGVCKCQDCKKS